MFLLVFVVQLLIYGFHELTEANIFPAQRSLALGPRNPTGPDGRYGRYLTHLLVMLSPRLAGGQHAGCRVVPCSGNLRRFSLLAGGARLSACLALLQSHGETCR